jgi:response regulator RpfG family c-di-GMP phosphodiesterase
MVGNVQRPEHIDQTTLPTIMVVANDLKLLKLLDLALSLELTCEVLTLDSSKSAVAAVKRIKPDLLILDEYLLDRKAHDLGTQLHSVTGLEQVPTLLINATVTSQSENKSYPTRSLSTSWKLEALYAAVHELLAIGSAYL